MYECMNETVATGHRGHGVPATVSRDTTGATGGGEGAAAAGGHGSVARARYPGSPRAQFRTHVKHDTNTEHDFPVGGIHTGLTPPTSDFELHPMQFNEILSFSGGGPEMFDFGPFPGPTRPRGSLGKVPARSISTDLQPVRPLLRQLREVC